MKHSRSAHKCSSVLAAVYIHKHFTLSAPTWLYSLNGLHLLHKFVHYNPNTNRDVKTIMEYSIIELDVRSRFRLSRIQFSK